MGYLLFLLGVVFGAVLSNILFYRKTVMGTLRIDRSNPEKEIYRMEVDVIDKLAKCKQVILKVDNDAHLPHN